MTTGEALRMLFTSSDELNDYIANPELEYDSYEKFNLILFYEFNNKFIGLDYKDMDLLVSKYPVLKDEKTFPCIKAFYDNKFTTADKLRKLISKSTPIELHEEVIKHMERYYNLDQYDDIRTKFYYLGTKMYFYDRVNGTWLTCHKANYNLIFEK